MYCKFGNYLDLVLYDKIVRSDPGKTMDRLFKEDESIIFHDNYGISAK